MARDLNRLNTAQWERPPHFLQERALPRPRAAASAKCTEIQQGGGVSLHSAIHRRQPELPIYERASTGLGYGNPPPRLAPHDHTHADADRGGIALPTKINVHPQ